MKLAVAAARASRQADLLQESELLMQSAARHDAVGRRSTARKINYTKLMELSVDLLATSCAILQNPTSFGMLPEVGSGIGHRIHWIVELRRRNKRRGPRLPGVGSANVVRGGFD